MTSPKISAIVQTYNAEKHLDRVLSALKDFDEILVVDMESTDSTHEICRRHGVRLIIKPRGEHRITEAYRDFSIHAAANDRVLIVDADEIVDQAYHENIPLSIKYSIDNKKTIDNMRLAIYNHTIGNNKNARKEVIEWVRKIKTAIRRNKFPTLKNYVN